MLNTGLSFIRLVSTLTPFLLNPLKFFSTAELCFFFVHQIQILYLLYNTGGMLKNVISFSCFPQAALSLLLADKFTIFNIML